LSGAANAWTSDNLLGAGRIDANEAGFVGSRNIAYQIGQRYGDAIAMITGGGEAAGGASGEIASVGIATPVAVPVAIHGSSAFLLGLKNLLFAMPIRDNSNSNKSKSSSSNNNNQSKSNGKTAGGGATDEHGNKLGPSGKPQINTVKHPSLKKAKDAARKEGKKAPVKHNNPKKGNSHYHPTDANEEKIPNSTHHEFP
jgi:hypothetical protein